MILFNALNVLHVYSVFIKINNGVIIKKEIMTHMELTDKHLNINDKDFSFLLTLKKICCKFLSHNFELQYISKIGKNTSCCVYKCKDCGLMSFEVI